MMKKLIVLIAITMAFTGMAKAYDNVEHASVGYSFYSKSFQLNCSEVYYVLKAGRVYRTITTNQGITKTLDLWAIAQLDIVYSNGSYAYSRRLCTQGLPVCGSTGIQDGGTLYAPAGLTFRYARVLLTGELASWYTDGWVLNWASANGVYEVAW
jgi:hypothetical protein